MGKWLIVGISGATCSGKTTLARRINSSIKNSVLISQDQYFLPVGDPRHTSIPELNHLNWEIMSSLDMAKMHSDVLMTIKAESEETCSVPENFETKLLIIEGFLIFNDKLIADLCDMKYYLTLPKKECWNRRRVREYDPPDVEGYFEKVVWPEYIKHKNKILEDKHLSDTVKFIDGTDTMEETFQRTFAEIKMRLHAKKL